MVNKEKIHELALDIMFDVSEEEAEDIEKDFVTLEKMLAFFDSIDTEGVEEMVYPFEEPTDFLRVDEVSNNISQKEALASFASVFRVWFLFLKFADLVGKYT